MSTRLEDLARRVAQVLQGTASCPNCQATDAHLNDCPVQSLIQWAKK